MSLNVMNDDRLTIDDNDQIVFEDADTTDEALILGCIPDMADNVPPIYQGIVPTLKCCQPNGNQIYSVLYAAGQGANAVLSDVPSSVKSDLESWYFRLGIALTLPWVIGFIIILVTLIVTNVISIASGIGIILVVIILAGISLAYVFYDASRTASNTYNTALNTVNENWDDFKSDISGHIIDAYLLEASCNKDEPYYCCITNNVPIIGCVSGCNFELTVNPEFVVTSSTGSMLITITDSGVRGTTGTVTIPKELNAAMGQPVVLPFDIKESGGTVEITYLYNSASAPSTVDITANMSLKDGPEVVAMVPITIINDPDTSIIRNRKVSSCKSCC